MTQRFVRAPKDMLNGRDKELAAWARDVSGKVDNTEYTIDDLSRVIFFANSTTQGQQVELDLDNLKRIVLAGVLAQMEEMKRKIRELETLAWQ